MKKIINLSIFAFLSLALSILGVGLNSSVAYAEQIDAPQYFSVINDSSGVSVANGGSVFISAGEHVTIGLNLEGTKDISDIEPHINLNGTSLSNADIKNMVENDKDYDIDKNEEGELGYYFIFRISGSEIFNTQRSDGGNLYGKFDLTFDYHETVEGFIVNRQFSYTFYLLKSDDYNLNKYKIQNAVDDGSSIAYAHKYKFNYDKEQMPKLTYDAKFFDVSIIKNATGQIAKVLNIEYRGQDLNYNNDVVYVSNDGSIVTVVFNDQATYQISYTYIHLDGANKINLKNTNGIDEMVVRDSLSIEGFALTYTDKSTSAGNRVEFKELDSTGKIITRTDYTYLGEMNVDDLINHLNDNNITLATTNQAPLQIVFNKAIDFDKTKLYTLTVTDDGEFAIGKINEEPLSNEYFTVAGKYILEVVSTGESAQWFAFEITNAVPSFTMEAVDRVNVEDKKIISTGAFTNKNVRVSYTKTPSVFDAKTKLYVTRYAYDKTTILNSDTVENLTQTFSEDGYYVVKLEYDKSTSASANFTIDTEEITDYSVFNVAGIGNNRYAKVNDVEFLTNRAISLYWSNKPSGATVSVEYKYFALESIDANYLDYYNESSYLKTFYSSHNNYSIPVLSQINYTNADITAKLIKPSNTTYINATSVLKDAGLYIFRISDLCGQEKYLAVMIDTTTPVILQENVDQQFVDVEDINTVSNDTTIYWGNQKIIKVNDSPFDKAEAEKTAWDKVLEDVYGEYFGKYTLKSSEGYYLEVPIDSTVYRSVGGEKATPLSTANITQYGTKIEFLLNGKANEVDYLFYFRDASNAFVGNTPAETYTSYPSAIHSIKVTSDASKTMLYYKSENADKSLVLANYYNDEKLDPNGHSKKEQYYQPTNKLTLGEDNKVYLSFVAEPAPDVVEVESVTCDFYPYETKNNGNFYYKDYAQKPQTKEVYKVENNTVVSNLTTQDEDRLVWEVNLYYDNYSESNITKEGKYVITRTYKILSNTLETTNKNYDYITRVITFYVDRNSIITTPEVVEENTVQSLVGGGIKVKITNDYFTEMYIAQNYTTKSKHAKSTHEGSIENIFKTNKLPVQIYIPYFKYGYEEGGQFKFVSNRFDANDPASVINYNSLNVAIYRYTSIGDLESLDVQGEVVYNSSSPEDNGNGYIKLPELKQIGYYEVIISQNDPSAPQYVVVFLISHESPQFIVTDDTNSEYGSLNTSNGLKYFTNKNLLRVSWTDDISKYMAKIDQENLKYYLTFKDGSATGGYTIDKKHVKTSETNSRQHWTDIDLSAIAGIDVENIQSVFVTASFEGDATKFAGNFSTTKEIVIDKTAPNESINILLQKSTLSQYANMIRNTTDSRYNSTMTEGMFKQFSFTVDKKDLKDIIKLNRATGEQAHNIWYREVDDKYTSGNFEETDPKTFVASNSFNVYNPNSTKFNKNCYYEIIESDLAGNRTVYTIYVTDIESEKVDKTLIEWETPVKPETQKINVEDYKQEIEIYAKREFIISEISLFNKTTNNGYPWYSLTVNGVTYFHTPYLAKDEYAIMSGKTYTLSQITTLTVASNEAMQTIVIGNAPVHGSVTLKVGVLSEDKKLNYLHFTETSLTPDADGNYTFVDIDGNTVKAKEGILVEIPQNLDKATIYATEVSVYYNDLLQLQIGTPLSSLESLNGVVPTDNVRVIAYNSGNALYAVIYVLKPTQNTYYIYQLADNFGQVYPPKTFIFGAEVANENFVSSVPIKTQTEDGKEYYYSTQDISFEFNSQKNYVVFNVLDKDGKPQTINTKDKPYETARAELLNCGIQLNKLSDVVHKVVLQASSLDEINNGIRGGRREFSIQIFSNIEVNIQGFKNEARNCTIVINNTVPEINLYGKNNENLNAILNNIGMIVGAPITIKFVDTSLEEYPNNVYLVSPDGSYRQIYSGYMVTEIGIYSIVVAYDADTIFGDSAYNVRYSFRISDEAVEFYAVYLPETDTLAQSTGKPFEFTTVDNKKMKIYKHYIVNSDYEIQTNLGQQISYKPVAFPNLTKTVVYEISNYGKVADGYNINYYKDSIAVTKVDKTNSIIDKFSYIEPEGFSRPLYDNLANDPSVNKENHTVVIEKGANYEPVVKYSWNSYYGIKENLVSVTVTDENNNILKPRTETIGNISYMYIEESGYYKIKFSDLAGNVQLFNSSEVFEITFLSGVIFNVNGGRPINNAIYDNTEPVVISIPSSSKTLYDNRMIPTIHVTKNGKEYKPESLAGRTMYKFTESGLYKVYFSATVGGKDVREEPYTFSIINKNETRWAFEYQEYANYYIDKIVKNGVDITEKLVSNPLMGNRITLEDETSPTGYKVRLKNIMISLFDEQTGAGRYELDIHTNDTNNVVFHFEFWINNAKPPIEISLDEGESTTKSIFVRFSKANVFNSVGDCIVRINGFNDLILNSDTILEGKDVVEVELKDASTYYVQLYTESGNLLYSYRVNKTEPLNAISIIIIIVGTIGLGGLITLFILLRRRMKVR